MEVPHAAQVTVLSTYARPLLGLHDTETLGHRPPRRTLGDVETRPAPGQREGMACFRAFHVLELRATGREKP
jgi:hypothetical protein